MFEKTIIFVSSTVRVKHFDQDPSSTVRVKHFDPDPSTMAEWGGKIFWNYSSEIAL